MKDDTRRINLRVPPEEWKRWDDLRHERGATFQSLGMDLFRRWYAGDALAADVPKQVKDERGLTDEDAMALRMAVDAITQVLHSRGRGPALPSERQRERTENEAQDTRGGGRRRKTGTGPEEIQ